MIGIILSGIASALYESSSHYDMYSTMSSGSINQNMSGSDTWVATDMGQIENNNYNGTESLSQLGLYYMATGSVQYVVYNPVLSCIVHFILRKGIFI